MAASPLAAAEPEARIYAFGDGIPHTPAEYAQLLTTLTNSGSLAVDDFSRGGVVEQLESRVASLLGKEAAVWLPTGTLANHLAIRLLAGNRRRVLVQSESHLFNDCGDCAQTLSGLHLVPLAPGRATFTVEDVDRAAYDAAMGRVETPIGAMQIETPVRRRQGERFRFRGDEEGRCLGARAQRRIASGWRTPVSRERLRGPSGQRVHGALRHGLHLDVQVLQCCQRRCSGGSESTARRPVSHAPHVRRRVAPGLALRRRRTALLQWASRRASAPRWSRRNT